MCTVISVLFSCELFSCLQKLARRKKPRGKRQGGRGRIVSVFHLLLKYKTISCRSHIAERYMMMYFVFYVGLRGDEVGVSTEGELEYDTRSEAGSDSNSSIHSAVSDNGSISSHGSGPGKHGFSSHYTSSNIVIQRSRRGNISCFEKWTSMALISF